jgi:drug/metabolite transporter (DMT)-like permease
LFRPNEWGYLVTLQEFVLFLISILTNSLGQFLLKAGAIKLGATAPQGAIAFLLGVLSTPELLLGLMGYGAGAMVYILLLTRVNLSVAGPATALAYVIAVLIGHFGFGEAIPPLRLLGLGFIITGVILVISRP